MYNKVGSLLFCPYLYIIEIQTMRKSHSKFKQSFKIELDPKEILRGIKGINRQEEIDLGERFPVHIIHKDRTTFTRKKKTQKRV